MPTTHPSTLFRALVLRHQALPGSLRRLWSDPNGLERAVDLCDDLLADLDVLITVVIEGMEVGKPWDALATDAITMKRAVYDQLIGFCSVRSPRLAAVLERSMARDLTDSADRLRAAESRARSRDHDSRASAHPRYVTPGWCA